MAVWQEKILLNGYVDLVLIIIESWIICQITCRIGLPIPVSYVAIYSSYVAYVISVINYTCTIAN